MKEKRKQVSFGAGPVEATYIFISNTVSSQDDPSESCDDNSCKQQPLSQRNELKSKFWYTEQDLVSCREDARKAIQALHQVDGQVDAVVDPDVCLRGIEKFADTIAKRRGQRMLVQSVLQQQRSNKRRRTLSHCDQTPKQSTWNEEDERHIASVSRYLSQPSKDMARFYATKTAEIVRQTLEQEGIDACLQTSLTPQSPNVESTDVYEIPTSGNKRPRTGYCDGGTLHSQSTQSFVQCSE